MPAARIALLPALLLAASAAGQAPPATDAERIARSRERLAETQKELAGLQKVLDAPGGHYQKAVAAFQAAERARDEKRDALEQLRQKGGSAEAIREAEGQLRAAEQARAEAQRRLDEALERRKVLLKTVDALKARAAQEQRDLDRLEGRPAPEAKPATPTPTAPTATAAPPSDADEPEQANPRVRAAAQRAEALRKSLKEAEQREQSVAERTGTLQRLLSSEKELAESVRELSRQREKELGVLAGKLGAASADDPGLPEVRRQHAEAQRRLDRAREWLDAADRRIGKLQGELTSLAAEQAVAQGERDRREREARAAEAELAWMRNPLAPHNLLGWLVERGPKVLLILLGVLALHRLVALSSRRIVQLVARESQRGSDEERENRARTLVSVFRYAATLVLYGGGGVMLLDAAGVAIVPLMGGAAVVGLAVAFGAQNLIRDYFSGFMILLEDQYAVNDVVRIGSLEGTVEKISLRATVLRDIAGVRHIIPHGTIASVSNMTYGWARATVDVTVPPSEDVDRVIEALREVGAEVRADPVYGPRVLEDLDVLGVDSLGPGSVVIKAVMKTRPQHQWSVRREMLRRVKKRFDEAGVAAPAGA